MDVEETCSVVDGKSPCQQDSAVQGVVNVQKIMNVNSDTVQNDCDNLEEMKL